MQSQKKHPRAFSFEFFPPKTPEGMDKLRATWKQLAQLKPRFFSCTYGAGGSTRDRTLETVLEIQAAGHRAAPHISCIGATRADVAATLELYKSKGIAHIVALHEDLRNFKRKVDAGADAAITQYFYNIDSYFRFVDDCEALGIDLPIVPGIMPIGNFSQLARFSDACGAEIPRWLRLKMQSLGDDVASIRSLGLDVVTDLCDRLLSAGAPGLHFYTMNQAGLTSTIWERLRIEPGAA